MKKAGGSVEKSLWRDGFGVGATWQQKGIRRYCDVKAIHKIAIAIGYEGFKQYASFFSFGVTSTREGIVIYVL
jgi:hypothetical protein